MGRIVDYSDNPEVLAELFRTLGQLSVRNEFCQEIKDHGGLELILNALDSNMDDRVRVVTVIILVLLPVACQLVPSQCLTQPNSDAVSHCQGLHRAGSVHHGADQWVLHGLMDAAVPRLWFALDRPTCVRNRLSAFQVVQGFSAPAGMCSSALMLRSTGALVRAAFVNVMMLSVHLIKLL